MANNSNAFERVHLEPRVLVDVSQLDTKTSVMGLPMRHPFAFSPTGFTRIATSAGELAVARVAARHGVPYTLSTLGTRSIEEVAAVSDGPLWYQLYVWKDRGLSRELVQRAKRPATRRSWSPSTRPSSVAASATYGAGSRCHPRSVSTRSSTRPPSALDAGLSHARTHHVLRGVGPRRRRRLHRHHAL